MWITKEVVCRRWGHIFCYRQILNLHYNTAQSAGAVEYTDCISAGVGKNLHSQRVSWIWYETIRWWDSCNAGASGNAENIFITIALAAEN